MEELFNKYLYLKQYPEFDKDTIEKKYSRFNQVDNIGGGGEMIFPPFIFDTESAFRYVVLMYSKDSTLLSISDIDVRKSQAMEIAKVPKDKRSTILKNENPMVADMITRLFRIENGFDFELLESAREAISILLDVVRKPISKELEDDKARNAVKAKRECFEDATFLIKEVKRLTKELNDISPDVADNVSKSAFKAGIAESLITTIQRKS